MPYINIWIHLIWATKNRQPILCDEVRFIFFQHIQQNSISKGIHLDFINGTNDHVHALISLKADQNISKIVQLLKGESSRWINKNHFYNFKFEWQDEYIAISVSPSILKKVRFYIKNQDEHHKKKSFGDEYKEFIEKYKFGS